MAFGDSSSPHGIVISLIDVMTGGVISSKQS